MEYLVNEQTVRPHHQTLYKCVASLLRRSTLIFLFFTLIKLTNINKYKVSIILVIYSVIRTRDTIPFNDAFHYD